MNEKHHKQIIRIVGEALLAAFTAVTVATVGNQPYVLAALLIIALTFIVYGVSE